MAQAYDAIIATITVASDASQVVKAMVKSTVRIVTGKQIGRAHV